MFLRTFLYFVVALSSFGLCAQTTISGTVISADDDESLPGVTVSVQGTTRGTITDLDGNYTLEVSDGETLVYSFLGFVSQSIVVDGRSVIDVVLETDVKALEEVVIVGYGQTTKKEVTGAVARVDAEVLAKNATFDVATALQGQIAGVSIQAASGEPGAAANIRIRGTGSITGFEGSSDPLYVIDGVPQPLGFNPNLSPNEIESIDVLKDVASAAVYGVKGAGGVIFVTTKRGRQATFNISLDSWAGIQRITSGTPLVGSEDHLYLQFRRSFNNDPNLNYGNTFNAVENNTFSLTNNSDILDIIEVDNALTTNHSINVTGGENSLSYNIVGSYYYQEGSLVNADYGRYNLRSNTTYKKDKWTVSSGIGLRREDRTYSSFGLLQDAIRFSPLVPQLDPNAPTIEDPGDGGTAVATGNIAAKLRRDDTSDENHLNGFIQLDNQVTKGLKLSTRIGGSTTDLIRKTVFPLFVRLDQNTGEEIPQTGQTQSRVINLSQRRVNWAWESFVTYNKKFGDSRIVATGVFSIDRVQQERFQVQSFDLISNEITVLDATSDPAPTTTSFSDNAFSRNFTIGTIGILGRVKYDFKNGKYVVSALLRRDASTKFAENSRWLTSPSLSFAWNVADEGFFSPVLGVISSFKLRGGWGQIGNQSIPDYGSQSTIAAGLDYAFGGSNSEDLAIGVSQQRFANPNVQWETKTEVNVGADMGLFEDRVQLEINAYRDERSDLLAFVTPSGSSGSSEEITRNIGDMINRGIEASIRYRRIGKLNWTIGATFARNVNEVTSLPGDAGFIQYFENTQVVRSVPGEFDVVGLQEGQQAFSYFLHRNLGVIKDSATLLAYQQTHDIAANAQLGDLMYEDVNGDGRLDALDRVASGNGRPDFEIGLNFDISYKNFDFSMQWFGAFGLEVMNGTRADAYKHGRHEELLFAWNPSNSSSDIPAYRGRDHPNYWGFTDYWMEDAAYVRLRNISLGYSLPAAMVDRMGISRLRVYIASQNPITITGYTGYDPEIGGNGLASTGLDRGNFPISATYRGGLELTF